MFQIVTVSKQLGVQSQITLIFFEGQVYWNIIV